VKKMFLLLATLVVLAGACGGGENDAASLPVNDGADPPAVASPCLEDEPECDDTPTDLEPQDLPSGDSTVANDGLVIGGGLTVTEALETNAEGVIAVRGFLVVNGEQARLCEALAESFPPQCGGASVSLDSIDQFDPAELVTEGDVTWTDLPVTIVGEVLSGTLVATPISQ
jgi:hypothetical protein